MKYILPFIAATIVLPLLVGAGAEPTDELPRRAYMGTQLDARPSDEPGVAIIGVLPESSAEAAGLQAGDRILEAAGVELATYQDLLAVLRELTPGDELPLVLLRDGARQEMDLRVLGLPSEHAPGSEVLYDSVMVNGDRLRTIVTRPGTPGRHPAVLFLQGLGCASYDFWFDADDSVKRLLDGWAEAGFVTMRVEKSGEGDSEGPPCSEIDFDTELLAYQAGLAALLEYDFVDPDRVFLFGHSMGGVMAPLVAADEPVAGIAVFGTISKNFLEYMLENFRRQDELEGLPGALIDASQRERSEFQMRLLVDRMTPGEIFRAYPHLEGRRVPTIMDDTHYFGRHASFYHQLQALNIAEAWAAVDAAVLAIHGEYDWVSAADDHPLIAAIVNAEHPDRARAIEIDGMDHGFLMYDTIEDSFVNRREGEFGREIVDETVAWMRSVGR